MNTHNQKVTKTCNCPKCKKQSSSPTGISGCKELTIPKNTPKLSTPTNQSGNRFYPLIQLPLCPSRNQRCQGPTGPKGETGATGSTGPTGPKGGYVLKMYFVV